MGKYSGLVVVAALLLAGCASEVPAAAPTATATATPDAVEAKAIEVSGDTPEAAPAEVVDEEARYLKGIKASWRTEPPTDEDLLSVALLACDQMRAGTQPSALNLVTGGTPEDNEWHSLRVGATASSTICQDAVPPL